MKRRERNVVSSFRSHSTGRTSECNISNKNQNHFNFLKGCTSMFFHLLGCFYTKNYLICFVSGQMPKTGVCAGDWKKTCKNEKKLCD